MKHTNIFTLGLVFIINYLHFANGLVQIELKKSMAKFHHEYLKNLKFTQVNQRFHRYSASFLEEFPILKHV